MTPEQVQQFRSAIIAACDAFIAKGGIIISGNFYDNDDCQCPIACLSNSPDGGYEDSVSATLGFKITSLEMWSFIDGFDGKTTRSDSDLLEMIALGKEIRDRYNP